MQTLLVYFSLEGNTDYAATRIASEIGADSLRLSPLKAYPSSGLRKFLHGGRSSMMEELPVLAPYSCNISAYDRIIFGFPVWAGNIAPPIRTFIHKHDLRGKRFAAFACQSGAGAEKAFGKLKTLLGIDNLDAELILINPKAKPRPENDSAIQAFCLRLNASPQ